MASIVLDSFAFLAFLRGEDGKAVVRRLLERAGERNDPLHMTEVNYAEVKYITVRKDGRKRWDEIASELLALPLRFHPVTRQISDIASDVKAKHPLSLADAMAVALAKINKATLVTGDPEFKAVEAEVKVLWI